MSTTPMLDKAATEELTSYEIQLALDELERLNRGGSPRLTIGRGTWGESRATIDFSGKGEADYIAPTAEDVLCKANKDLLRLIAAEAASDEDAA